MGGMHKVTPNAASLYIPFEMIANKNYMWLESLSIVRYKCLPAQYADNYPKYNYELLTKVNPPNRHKCCKYYRIQIS